MIRDFSTLGWISPDYFGKSYIKRFIGRIDFTLSVTPEGVSTD